MVPTASVRHAFAVAAAPPPLCTAPHGLGQPVEKSVNFITKNCNTLYLGALFYPPMPLLPTALYDQAMQQ